MRANTIALRRIAEQNQIDIHQAQVQAEISRRNSESMTKIAYMTMCYLPATFCAVSSLFLCAAHDLKFRVTADSQMVDML